MSFSKNPDIIVKRADSKVISMTMFKHRLSFQ